MKIIKKLDDSYRIVIPQEIRQSLGIQKRDSFEIEYENSSNKIILTYLKNDPDLNLEASKIEQEQSPKVETEESEEIPVIIEDNLELEEIPIKPVSLDSPPEEPNALAKPKRKKHIKSIFKDTDEISFISTSDLQVEQYCNKCGVRIDSLNMTNIKVNNSILCTNCLQKLKEQISNR